MFVQFCKSKLSLRFPASSDFFSGLSSRKINFCKSFSCVHCCSMHLEFYSRQSSERKEKEKTLWNTGALFSNYSCQKGGGSLIVLAASIIFRQSYTRATTCKVKGKKYTGSPLQTTLSGLPGPLFQVLWPGEKKMGGSSVQVFATHTQCVIPRLGQRTGQSWPMKREKKKTYPMWVISFWSLSWICLLFLLIGVIR